MDITKHPFFSTHGLLLARVLLGALFILSGIGKFQDIAGTAGYIESVGLPAGIALAWLAAIIETVGGAAIIVGYRIKEAALMLAVFVFVISFPFHGPSTWAEDPMQQINFLKNMSVVGGFLFVVAHGAGKTWRLGA